MLKNCIVTGGPRGIGRATALLAAKTGYAVAIAGLAEHASDARTAATEIHAMGGRAIVLEGDVSRDEDVLRMFDEAEHALGPVRGVVNAAGVSHHARVEDFQYDDLSRLMAVNVIGLMICCREAARRMSIAHGGMGGAIVNISSMAATIGGRPGFSAYAASKGAVDVFTSGFAREVAADGIRVNTIRPGIIATTMTARLAEDPELRMSVEASIPIGRLGRAEEIAEAAVWLLSDNASLITGAHLNAGGGGFHVAGSRS